MPDDDDLIPLSALQHFLVCPRQCGLIHLEQLWEDNRLTAEGNVLHAAVDHVGGGESRKGVRRVTGLPLKAGRLGLVGRADVVEFHGEVPFPVEHKRGREKKGDDDRVQLCAQALCLEEMLGVPVPEGALFYAQARRRVPVLFDEGLRARTLEAVAGVRAMMDSRRTPPAVPVPACRGCSLVDLCLPQAAHSVERYFKRGLAEP